MNENEQGLVSQPRQEVAAPHFGLPKQQPAAQAQLSVSDIGRMLGRRKYLILACVVLSASAMAFYAWTKQPVYEGVARLQIDPSRSSNIGLDDPDKSEPTDIDGVVKTEVEIIRSNTVATQVMEALKLYTNPRFAGPDTVTAPVTDFSELPAAQQRRLLDRFDGDLTVRVVPSTEIVEIRFRNPDPELAAETTNSIIDEYLQRNLQARVEGATKVTEWLSKQMEEIRATTTQSQEKLVEFQRENNLLGSDASDNIVTDRLKQLNEELTQAEADRIIKEGRYRLADSGNPELIGSMLPSPTLQELRGQRATIEAQYSLLSAKYGSGYPKLREVQSQLDALNESIKNEDANIKVRLGNEYDVAVKAESMMRVDFEKQKAEAFKLNEHAAQYAILKHAVESGQQLYDTLQLKVKEAGITSGLSSSYVSVIDRAQLPDAPVEPRPKFYLAVGLAGGLFGGVMFGLILDSFDDTMSSPEELELASALPELASVPFVALLSGKKEKGIGAPGLFQLSMKFDPILIREPNCPTAEAYRSLCSVVLHYCARDSAKVLVVTSAMAGEGKSTVSCNLATGLAQRGYRVLLVDADMRCSISSQRNGAGSSLSTILTDAIDLKRHYQPFPELPNLTILPAGLRPNNPTDILGSSRMLDLMAEWRREYDYIIVDTPPVLPFSDALVVATLADGLIMVARSGISQKKALLRAKTVLGRSGANILGFVLNAVKHGDYIYDYPAGYKSAMSSQVQ